MVLYLCIFTSGPLVSLFAVIRAGCCVVSSEEPLNGTEDCTHGDWSWWLRKILTFIVQRRNRWLQFAVGFILWSFEVIFVEKKAVASTIEWRLKLIVKKRLVCVLLLMAVHNWSSVWCLMCISSSVTVLCSQWLSMLVEYFSVAFRKANLAVVRHFTN